MYPGGSECTQAPARESSCLGQNRLTLLDYWATRVT